MPRTVRLAALALLSLAACERAEVRVEPSAIAGFEGVRTVVHVQAALGCDDPEPPVLELLDGAPAASAFAAEVHEVPTGEATYFIGNPGRDRDIYVPDAPSGGAIPANPATGRYVTVSSGRCCLTPDAKGFDVIVTPAIGAGVGEHRLRVRVRGCGTEASADLTVNVLGRLDLGAFCGITTGATCADDGGCERAGCGELCAAAGTVEAAALGERLRALAGFPGSQCLASACTDPVPSGATCGCVLGACAWRPP